MRIDYYTTATTWQIGFYSAITSENVNFIPYTSITYSITDNTIPRWSNNGIGVFRRFVHFPTTGTYGASFADIRFGETYESVCMVTTDANIQVNRIRSGTTVSMIDSNIIVPYNSLSGTTSISSTNNRVQEDDIIEVQELNSNPLSKGAFVTLQFEY
jgi:hypothetical protein